MASGKPDFICRVAYELLKIRAGLRCYKRTNNHLTLLLNNTLLYTVMLSFITPVLPSNNRSLPCVCREDQPHSGKPVIACTVYYPRVCC